MPPKFRRDYERIPARQPEGQRLLDDYESDDELIGSARSADPKVSRLQGQVDDVIDVMQDNIGRVMDRGERLDDLQDKSESLASNADVFRSRAKTLRNQMWWKECRMRIVVAIVITIILLIIIIPIILKMKKNGQL